MGTQSDWHSPVSLSSCSEPLSSLSIGSPSVRPLSPPGDSSPGATSHTRKIVQGHCEEQQNGSTQGYTTTIGTLSDNILLEIFDFYRHDHEYLPAWKWHLLVHVCQTWRQIIFASPLRLDLKILCTYGTPVRKNLGIWPAFPIIIRYSSPMTPITRNDEDNIISALEHRDRVCDVSLHDLRRSRLEKFVTMMQEPFPVLAYLYIGTMFEDPPSIPAKFLGGSAPCLQEISLSGIPFPTLLLSVSDLVGLCLRDIPPTGYVPPQALVASLVTLPRLDSFTIGFRSATSRPDRIRPPPMTRTVLPALTSFRFIGASEYLEDLVTQIDIPQLNQITIEYLRLVDYEVTQLSKFIDRSLGPKLTQTRHARVLFSGSSVMFSVHVNRPSWHWSPPNALVSCGFVDWHALDLDIARLLSHFPTTLSHVLHLNIEAGFGQSMDMGDVDWLRLLHQFSTAQTLRLGCGPAEHVALALEDISGGLVAEVLPSLDLVYIEAQPWAQPVSTIEKFIAARELSGCPVIVVDTETEFDKRLESYVSK